MAFSDFRDAFNEVASQVFVNMVHNNDFGQGFLEKPFMLVRVGSKITWCFYAQIKVRFGRLLRAKGAVIAVYSKVFALNNLSKMA